MYCKLSRKHLGAKDDEPTASPQLAALAVLALVIAALVLIPGS